MEEDLGLIHFWSTIEYDVIGNERSFVLYLRHFGLSLFRLLGWLNHEATIRFVSIGGSDRNGTYTEHSIFMRTPIEPENPLDVLKIMMLERPTVSQIIDYLNESYFEAIRYNFSTSDNVDCYNGFHKLTGSDVLIKIPLGDKEKFMANMLQKEPKIGKILSQNPELQNYYVYEGNSIKAIYPEVWHIDEFLTKDYKEMVDMFDEIDYTVVPI